LCVYVNSPSKYLWKDLEESDFDTAEFDKLFSKAPAKVKSPTSKRSEIKRAKVVSVFVLNVYWSLMYNCK